MINSEVPDLDFRGGEVETEADREREQIKADLQKRNDEIEETFKTGFEKYGRNKDAWVGSPEFGAAQQENLAFMKDMSTKGYTLKEGSRELVEKNQAKKKTPREESMEKAEAHIQELGKTIELLEEQTPERIEEKKKTAECSALLQRENRLPSFAETLGAIDSANLVPQNHTVEYYSKQFGEGALKRALFEGLSPKIDKIVENEKKVYESRNGEGSFGSSNQERTRTRVENMIRAKIEASVVGEKVKDFEQNKGARRAEEEASTIWEKKRAAERTLPDVVDAT